MLVAQLVQIYSKKRRIFKDNLSHFLLRSLYLRNLENAKKTIPRKIIYQFSTEQKNT